MRVILLVFALLFIHCGNDENRIEIAFKLQLPSQEEVNSFVQANKIVFLAYRKTNDLGGKKPELTLGIKTSGAYDMCDESGTVCYEFAKKTVDNPIRIKVDKKFRLTRARFEFQVMIDDAMIFSGSSGDFNYYTDYIEVIPIALKKVGG